MQTGAPPKLTATLIRLQRLKANALNVLECPLITLQNFPFPQRCCPRN